MTASALDVAVGILQRPDATFLMAQRPTGKPMAGYWEFPGGKLEPGEDVRGALVREFQEELGVVITEASPWLERVHVYAHATVCLHFWRVHAWRGDPVAQEGQALRWETTRNLCVEPWLPGAQPLKRWLSLPDWYAISNASALGAAQFLARADRALSSRSVRLMQLREPDLDGPAFEFLLRELRARCLAHGAVLLVNSRHDERYWDAADGVHCTAQTAAALTRRPDVAWCAASCHTGDELGRAALLGMDFAVIGPVQATESHAGVAPLGWERLRALLAHCALPVYALGGLTRAHGARAQACGAHGVAALRASWEVTPSA